MKLFARYSRFNLLANLVIFVVASIAFYFSIRYVLVHQIDEDLQIEQDEITAFVHEHDMLPESFAVSDQVIEFVAVALPVQRSFTTIKMTGADSITEPYRQLVFGISAEGKYYRATVFKSLEGTDSLLRSILLVSVSSILLILLVSIVINRIVLKQLWHPFYESLNAVRNFRPSKDVPLHLPETTVDEFSTMNTTLQTITQTSRLDYLSLKTFSENASHEIQTPIAIIRSKLDLLIQDEQLTEGQSKTLQSAYNAVEKLSRLNVSLLLLAKIENRQFEEVQQIDLHTKVEEKLEEFQELWQARNISMQVSLYPSVVSMNNELAETLLNNLLSNAINHSSQGGKISINLNEDKLQIENTSNTAALEKGKLFQRFYKPSQGNANNGLGLSIIKQICDASGFIITYTNHQNQHCFTVHFR